MINVGILGAQDIVDHAVAPTLAGVSSLHDLVAQFEQYAAFARLVVADQDVHPRIEI